MFAEGSVALITGGCGGIGAEIVKLLAAEGVRAIAASSHEAQLKELDGTPNVEICHVDVTDADNLQALFEERDIDFLINAAGVLGVTGTLYSLPRASAQHIFDVNVIGMHNTLSAVVPGMIRRNRGHIVNIGSIAGPYPSIGQPMYSASKAAVHSMSMNLRMELFGTDIKVTELRPGRVRSGMHAEMFSGDHVKAAELLYDPYECLRGSDIAEVVKFVLDTPPEVCIAQIEVVPTHQVVGGTKMFQRGETGA